MGIDQKRYEKYWDKIQTERFGSQYAGARIKKLDWNKTQIDVLLHWMKNPFRMLVMYGTVGTSKTYPMAAMIPWVEQRGCEVKGSDGRISKMPADYRVYREYDLFSKVRMQMSEAGSHDYQAYVNHLCDCDVFFYDDLGKMQGTGFQKEVQTAFLDSRYNSEKPTIITTNLYPNTAKEALGEAAYSRLFSRENTLIRLDGEDRRNPLTE